MQSVLGLIPDRRPLSVQEPFADLLARMRGQAVKDDRVVARLLEKLLVEPERLEQATATSG